MDATAARNDVPNVDQIFESPRNERKKSADRIDLLPDPYLTNTVYSDLQVNPCHYPRSQPDHLGKQTLTATEEGWFLPTADPATDYQLV